MENTITAISLSPPSTAKIAQPAPLPVTAEDAQTGIGEGNEARADSRLERQEDRFVRRQDNFAELEAKARAAGYERLGDRVAQHAEAAVARQEGSGQDGGPIFGRLATAIANGWEMGDSVIDQLSAAVTQHAEQAVSRWDAFGSDMQERMAAAAVQATEAGQENIADRLGNRAEMLDELVDTRIDNILANTAQLIDRVESGGNLPPAEGVDLHA